MPVIAPYMYGVCGGAKLYCRSSLLCFLLQLEEFFFYEFSPLEMLFDWQVSQGPVMLVFRCVAIGKHISAEQFYQAGKEQGKKQGFGFLLIAGCWSVELFITLSSRWLQEGSQESTPSALHGALQVIPHSGWVLRQPCSSAGTWWFAKSDKYVGFNLHKVTVKRRFDPVSVCFVFWMCPVP